MKNEIIYKPKKNEYGQTKYIGNKDGEEYFITPIKFDCDWYWGGIYLEGLRPENEETLRERARDTEPDDMGIDIPSGASHYFDYDRWYDDMEEDWLERHDGQEEQERDGETYYLGFGCHTHLDSVILNECNGNYAKFKEIFEKTPLTEKQFNDIVHLAKKFYSLKDKAGKNYNKDNDKYIETMKAIEKLLAEWEELTNALMDLPTKEYWVNPEF